jgi:hypothetical protein
MSVSDALAADDQRVSVTAFGSLLLLGKAAVCAKWVALPLGAKSSNVR